MTPNEIKLAVVAASWFKRWKCVATIFDLDKEPTDEECFKLVSNCGAEIDVDFLVNYVKEQRITLS